MPRRSSTSSSTARSGASSGIAPPKQTNQNQVAPRSSMAGGLMGSLMSGMAFGAGAEFFRQMFRNPTIGPMMMPLILSGVTAFGAHKLLLKPSPYRVYYTAAVFGGSFLLYRGMFGSGEESFSH